MTCTRRMIRVGVFLGVLSAVLATNKYGDHGVVLTGLPYTPDGYNNLRTYSEDFANFAKSEIGSYRNENPFLAYTSCAVDYDMNHLYLYDFEERKIQLVENFNTSLIESELIFSDQHYGVAQEHNKVVVDWMSHNIYWTDAIHNWIAMQPGGPINDPSLYAVLVWEHLDLPRGLDIDPEAGYIFWTDAGGPAVERASLTGQNRKLLLNSNLLTPTAITADTKTQTLYIADRNTIYSIDYDGSRNSRKHLVRSSVGFYYDMAVFEDILVTVDIGDEFIHFYDKNTGMSMYEKHGSATEFFFGICLYQGHAPASTPDRCNDKSCSDICVNERAQATCLCREGFKLSTDGRTCTEDEGKFKRAIVISTDTKLCLLDIRILAKQHETYTNASCFYEGPADDVITHMDLNMRTREVYFSVNTTIYSIPIGGSSNQKRIITRGVSNVVGLSYDWVNDNIYFAMAKDKNESTPESIWTVQPGSDLVKEHKTNTNGYVRAILTVPYENRTYWIAGDSLIEYSDMGITSVSDIQLIDPEGSVFLYAGRMVHDVKYELIHILDSDYGDILTVHYNGTVDDYHLLAPNAIDFAIYKDFLLYVEHTDTATILKSADFYGGSPIQWMDFGELKNVGKVYNIRILDLDALQPTYKSPCANHNGGCEQLCYPQADKVLCECLLGYTLNTTDKKTCDPTKPLVYDNFVIFSDVTHNQLYQIDLTQLDILTGISTSRQGTPQGVTYDPTTKTVYWSDYDEGEIWKMSLDGGEPTLFMDLGIWSNYPRRLLRDPNSGYIYYTAESSLGDIFYDSYIGVIDQTGTMHGDIIDFGHIPSAMAIHPTKGWIFWSDFGTIAPAITRANMDGSDPQVLIDEDIIFPNGLAIDYDENLLYWTDGFYNKLYSCQFDGSDRATFLEDKKAHLMDLILVDGYLYYTSWNNPHITKVNKKNVSDSTMIAAESGVGRMTAMFLYSSTATTKIPETTVCAEGNHMCSHFCFPVQSNNRGYACGCEGYYSLLADGFTCSNAPRCPAYVGMAAVKEDTSTCLRMTGNKCDFTCKDGYRRNSDALLTCTSLMDADGSLMWDNNDPCEQIRCPFDIDNGKLHDNCSREVGADCIDFTCAAGHERNPDVDDLVCQADGTWKITKTLCEEKCPPITSATERAQFVGNCGRNPGDTCRFACDPKYKFKTLNVNSITCQAGSKWDVDTWDLCEEIMCPDYITNGVIVVNGVVPCTRRVGEMCHFRCDDRFDPHPTITKITCRLDGTWDQGDDKAQLCTAVPLPAAKSSSSKTAVAVGAGVGVGVLVLIVIIVIVVVFLFRQGKLRYGTSSKPPPAVSFENPRYGNGSDAGEASGEFGHPAREDDKADLTKDSWTRTMGEQNTLHVYDNPTSIVQP